MFLFNYNFAYSVHSAPPVSGAPSTPNSDPYRAYGSAPYGQPPRPYSQPSQQAPPQQPQSQPPQVPPGQPGGPIGAVSGAPPTSGTTATSPAGAPAPTGPSAAPGAPQIAPGSNTGTYPPGAQQFPDYRSDQVIINEYYVSIIIVILVNSFICYL